MTTKNLNLPYDLDLVKASAWSEIDKNLFFILRLHLHIVDYQAEPTTYPGEILGTFHAPHKAEIINAIEKEHSIVNVDETIISQVRSDELLTGIESELSAGIGLPPLSLGAKIKGLVHEKVAQSYGVTTKESASISYRQMKRFEVHQTIFGPEKYHAVAYYQPRRSDVYLHYVDYLFAEYRTSVFGLRKKKKNLPRPVGDNHINRQVVNQSLFTLRYWELLPESSNIYSDKEYKKLPAKILTPENVRLEQLDKAIHLPLPSRPERPTLYTLSNIAFPFRWIDRQGDWTVEDLKKIEMDEAEGSAWWFKHGPGR